MSVSRPKRHTFPTGRRPTRGCRGAGPGRVCEPHTETKPASAARPGHSELAPCEPTLCSPRARDRSASHTPVEYAPSFSPCLVSACLIRSWAAIPRRHSPSECFGLVSISGLDRRSWAADAASVGADLGPRLDQRCAVKCHNHARVSTARTKPLAVQRVVACHHSFLSSGAAVCDGTNQSCAQCACQYPPKKARSTVELV